MRPLLRGTRRFLCSMNREARQNIDDLFVARLPEIVIKITDCAKDLMIFKADHFVGLALHLGERIRRRNWNGEDEFFGLSHPGGAQGSAGRRAGGYSIVDDDLDMIFHDGSFPAAKIAMPPALDFREFLSAHLLELGLIDPGEPNDVFVANDDRRFAVNDGTH